MANDDKLYIGWELKGEVQKQIKDAIKSSEELQKAISEAVKAGNDKSLIKLADNVKANVKEAEKALYRLMDAKEKAEKVVARNAAHQKEDLWGFDTSALEKNIGKIDEIVRKIMNIGVKAAQSKNAVKDLLEELSVDIVLKDTKSKTSDINKSIDKQERKDEKAAKDAAKEAKKSAKESEEAAVRNAAAQQKVQDALAKIATARSQLSAASSRAGEQERMHVQLLLSLLDRLSGKLAGLKGTFLGEKGALAGVLGSGYQGLMRNVGTAIGDLQSGRLRDQAEAANQQKVEDILRMRQHRKDMLSAKDDAEMAAAAREVNKTLEENKKRQAEAAQAARDNASANKGLADVYSRLSSAGTNTNKILEQMKNQFASYVSLYGFEHLIKSIVTIGGQFEFQHRALQNIVGDIQDANTLFTQLQGLAVESPKTFQELTAYAKQLSAYQIPADELFDTTKRLADLSTGLGVDMNRLILAYGQVRSAAVLRGQELRQFTEAGIPMVQALADRFTEMNGQITTTADVFKLISQRAVPFEMVKDVLWDMTSQGGQFFNMQSELADTLYGKWQKLQDTWQIMLGNLADSKSPIGSLIRLLVDGAVALVSSLDTLTPMLTSVGLSRLFKMTKASYDNSGVRGLQNMVSQAQRLRAIEIERMRINGEINAKEYQRLTAHNQEIKNHYRVLAMEGRLSNYELQRLLKQGQINQALIEQLRIMHLITAEEEKNILGGKVKGGFFAKMGKGISGFLGGPVGIAITAIGAGLSLLSKFRQEQEALSQRGDAMVNDAQKDANSLGETLRLMDGDDSIKKKITALEDALLGLGRTGRAIVAEGRKAAGDAKQQLETLTEGAKAYREVLDFMGTQKGKALFEGFIDSGIEDAAKDYDALVNDMTKHSSSLSRYSSVYKEAIEKIIASDEELAKKTKGKGLTEQIDVIGYERMQAVLNEIRKPLMGTSQYGSGIVAHALNGLHNHFRWISMINKEWKDLAEESIPEAIDELRAAAMDNGITDFSNLSHKQQKSLEALARNYAEKMDGVADETRDKIASELAKQAFHITIAADIEIDETTLSPFADFVWGRFGGNVSKDGTINIGKKKFTKSQVKNIFEDPDTFTKNANSQVDELKTTIGRLMKAGATDLADKASDERDAWLSVLSALGLRENKNGKGSGSQKDAVLDRAKTRLDEVKDFYAEYKKYREQYGKEKGLSMVADIFGMDESQARDIAENYSTVLGRILAAVPQNTEARKKFALGIKKLLGDIKIDDLKHEMQESLKEVERYLQDETSKWDLYKGLLEKTGSRAFAMQAFEGGVLWDDRTLGMAERLRSMVGEKVSGRGDLFDMDEGTAETVFGKGTAALKLWDEIVKSIKKNWADGLNEVAAATEKLLTTEDKIVKTEQELADLRRKYGVNDPRSIAKERDLANLRAEAFEQSEPYLRFYSAIFAMTTDEAETAGQAIKENLVKQLADGTINADKYLKSIKNIDQQLEKARGVRSDAMTLMTGGYKGMLEKRGNQYDSQAADAAIRVQMAEEAIQKARLDGAKAATDAERERARQAELKARIDKTIATGELEDAQKKFGWTQASLKEANEVLDVMTLVDDVLAGMKQAAQQLSDMFDALGHEHTANTWSDIADTIGAIAAPVSAARGAMTSAMNGDIGGAISGVVGIFTSPITAFAQLHDKKRQRKIEESTRKVNELTAAYQNLQHAIEDALGGIYSAGGYDEMYENLLRQREEVQKQYDLEKDKKKSDGEALSSYEQQLAELDENIRDFGLDMADALYSINLQDWASQLTDAIVGAWERGENAMDAYRTKVKELMKDLTKNILAKRVLEQAFSQLGIDQIIANEMFDKSGKLNEGSIEKIADLLYQAGEMTTEAITKTLDNLEGKGYVDRGDGSSSSSIRSITENTADLLASYVNAIRADVSVDRQTLSQILSIMQAQSQLPVLAEAQLTQLESIAQHTARNAAAAEAIRDILNGNVNGTHPFRVR